jgi:hypothetical protein
MVVREDKRVIRVTRAVAKLNRAVVASNDVNASTYDAVLALNARALHLDGSALQLSEQALPEHPSRLGEKIEKLSKRVRTLDKAVRDLEPDTWVIIPDVTPDDPDVPAAEPTPAEEPVPAPAPTAAVNVRDYGATGDGVSDDTAAIVKAMSAATGGTESVYLPAGTYRVTSISVPDGLVVTGAGMGATWLKGHVDFGSSQSFSDLKVGDLGVSAVKNKNGATGTTFERVRFRGGGVRAWTYVVSLGSGASCSQITFKDCLVERNLGVEVVGEDRGFNNITLWTSRTGRVSDVTFEGCYIGVSNGQSGRSVGSPRMGIECYVNQATAPTDYGWKNVVLRNTVFEAADCHTADFSDIPSARGTGLLIEGCTFKGGGYSNVKWMWTLALEMPLNPVVRNNLFLRGNGTWGYILGIADRGDTGYTSTGALITGNTFDLDFDNGIPISLGWPFVLQGYDNRFIGNTVHCHYGTRDLMVLDRAYRNTVTGNTFNIGSRPLLTQINGSSGNTVTPNTVR